MSAHTPGPVETLARLAIQSDRYTSDEEFCIAVDAVIGKPVFDAAPDLLAELKAVEAHLQAYVAVIEYGGGSASTSAARLASVRAVISKATGGAA